MGDTEYSVTDTSDTTSRGFGIDYWLGIARYLHPFFLRNFNFLAFFVKTNQDPKKCQNNFINIVRLVKLSSFSLTVDYFILYLPSDINMLLFLSNNM